MRIERDAGVLVGEGLFGVVVHQNATFALLEAAIPRRLGIGRYADRAIRMERNREARRAHAVFIGLVRSVLGSGDGKSLETAFVVIAIDEEYAVMAALSLRLVSQALVNLGEPPSTGSRQGSGIQIKP